MENLILMKQLNNNNLFSLPVVILVKKAIKLKPKAKKEENYWKTKRKKFYLYKSTDCSCCCNCQHVVILLLLLMIMILVVLFSFSLYLMETKVNFRSKAVFLSSLYSCVFCLSVSFMLACSSSSSSVLFSWVIK